MSLPQRRVWVDGLVTQRFPMTNRRYLAFLNDLLRQGRADEALRHVPRERADTRGNEGALIYGFDGQRFFLQPDADGDVWEPEWPLLMGSWFGAQAYCEWLWERTGQAWRLPNELEWEKAGRGVDRRLYPWGDVHDPSWACNRLSHRSRPLPSVVDTYPTDISPYGLRCVSGQVREWCIDIFEGEGPTWVTDRAPGARVVDADNPHADRVYRGGCWSSSAANSTVLFRESAAAEFRSSDTGFRCFRTVRGS